MQRPYTSVAVYVTHSACSHLAKHLATEIKMSFLNIVVTKYFLLFEKYFLHVVSSQNLKNQSLGTLTSIIWLQQPSSRLRETETPAIVSRDQKTRCHDTFTTLLTMLTQPLHKNIQRAMPEEIPVKNTPRTFGKAICKRRNETKS